MAFNVILSPTDIYVIDDWLLRVLSNLNRLDFVQLTMS